MKYLNIFLILFLAIGQAYGENNDVLIALRAAKEFELTSYQTKLLLAIRAVEDGREGREYGVLSAPATTQEEQARITARSIRNSWTRWEKGGKSGDFIHFFRLRWAPDNADNDPKNLNSHWEKNVRFFLKILEGEKSHGVVGKGKCKVTYGKENRNVRKN